jgi:benzoyl-CoA reductase subunit D
MTDLVSAGIDVGTSAIKVAILASPHGSGRARAGARMLASYLERVRRRDQRQVIALAYERALEIAGLARTGVDYLASTGEGEAVEFRTGHFYGMTAHARGAVFLDPEVKGAIDIGALHARAIRFDEQAKVLDYRMTSQCASGTGQFLENIARYLGVTLGEIGPLSLEGKEPEKISGICAVLAETDVINLVSRGVPLPNILKGIHASMADRLAKLVRSARAAGPILLTGGLSADVGLVASLKEAAPTNGLGELSIRSHPHSALAGAIGAALWGAYRCERLRAAG